MNQFDRFVVKFMRWDVNTISALVRKTIKFSTVFDFNDFNEYRYIGLSRVPHGDNVEDEIKEIINSKLDDLEFTSDFLRLARERYGLDLSDNDKNNAVDSYIGILEEALAYRSVGIFSSSNLKVFETDSAQLMFAHYADNLKGLALIYEIDQSNNIRHIEYIDINRNQLKLSGGETNRILKWYEGDYSSIDDFTQKSKNWEYENEKRIFSRPEIKPASKAGLKLKCILFTPRFSSENIMTLKEINSKCYNEELDIQKISPSVGGYLFKTDLEKNKTVIEHLEKLL